VATNWHGPLNLHFHLDLLPQKPKEGGLPGSAASIDPETH
jgi:hypothetical protein